MYNTLKRLYLRGQLDETGLDAAVEKGYISSQEKEKIMASKKN